MEAKGAGILLLVTLFRPATSGCGVVNSAAARYLEVPADWLYLLLSVGIRGYFYYSL